MAKKNKNAGKPRNYTLECGIYRFGKSKTYHKKAIYKFLKKKTAKTTGKPQPAFIEKKIGGARNGETRMVRVKRLRNDYPTQELAPKGTSKNFFSTHSRKLRPSLYPGVIAIILAGVHKGKRVIVLKQLQTGLLLITGPFKINGCPLRRINQRYLLATSTTIDVTGVKVPDTINDEYFRRVRAAKKQAKKEGDIFESKKEDYKPSEQRKKDQTEIDTSVLSAIKKHPEGKFLKQYLRHNFSLSKGQFPHQMCF
jgi:large subunit ribosomal protein L6e